jgi:hypothetical protein
MARRRFGILSCVLILVATLLGMLPGAVARGTISGHAWGWVVVRPNFPLIPAPADQGNSTGATNRVERWRAGTYKVTFPGIFNMMDSSVHVTALSDQPRTCRVTSRNMLDFTDVIIWVDCGPTGDTVLVDTPFVLSVLQQFDFVGRLGYLWYDAPGGQGDLTPAVQFNSLRKTNRVRELEGGKWLATLPGLASALGAGHVQVSAMSYLPCSLGRWFAQGADVKAVVSCYGQEGQNPGHWQLTYIRNAGLVGPGVKPAAYLLADRPAAASYTPAAGSRYSSAGAAPTVTRSGTGRYSVTLPGMPLGGGAHVTALGSQHACTVSSIRKVGLPQRIGVRCFGAAGQPVDSRFTVAYFK